jgi:hypothetical protein
MRAWIAEVERKLGKRTRVFLALTVIAIGIAGASLYLAIDARNSSVSEGDVQKLQQELETRIDESSGGGATVPPVEEVEPTPEPTPTPPSQGQGSKPKNGQSGGGGGDSSGNGGASANPGGATGGAANSAQLQELLEQAKKRSEQNE